MDRALYIQRRTSAKTNNFTLSGYRGYIIRDLSFYFTGKTLKISLKRSFTFLSSSVVIVFSSDNCLVHLPPSSLFFLPIFESLFFDNHWINDCFCYQNSKMAYPKKHHKIATSPFSFVPASFSGFCLIFLVGIFCCLNSGVDGQKFQYSKGWMPGGKRSGGLARIPPISDEEFERNFVAHDPEGPVGFASEELEVFPQDDFEREDGLESPLTPSEQADRPIYVRSRSVAGSSNAALTDNNSSNNQAKMLRYFLPGWQFVPDFQPIPQPRGVMAVPQHVPVNSKWTPRVRAAGRGFHRLVWSISLCTFEERTMSNVLVKVEAHCPSVTMTWTWREKRTKLFGVEFHFITLDDVFISYPLHGGLKTFFFSSIFFVFGDTEAAVLLREWRILVDRSRKLFNQSLFILLVFFCRIVLIMKL